MAKKETNNIVVSTKVTPSLKKKLEQLAAKENRKVSFIVNRIIAAALQK